MEEQPVAIVTGASSGVGRACAKMLAQLHYRVVLVARTKENLDQAVAAIEADHPGAELVARPADVSGPEGVQTVIDQTLERFGRIDAIVNTAGSAPLQPIDRVTPEIWQQCIDSNLASAVHMTAKAWPTLKKQRSGVIVNVSSMAAFDPITGFNIYGAAKAGVNLLTYATAQEGKKPGIKTVCVAPGAIETPMLRQHFSEKVLPKDKTLAPEDVATVIVDCITGDREFTSGETIQLPSH
jgi:NAD(P)-dependent dehydrogenase (short-subunit alcohol dehydrogenase family)